VEGQLQIHVYLCNARCAGLRCIHSATCPFEGDLWRQWRLFVNGAGARAAGGESKCGRPWGRATAGEPISAPDPQCLMTLTISQQDHRTVRQSHMHTVNNLEPMRAGNKRAKRRSTIAASTSCAFHQLRASRLAESAQMQPPIINAGRGDRLLLDAQAFDLFSIFEGPTFRCIFLVERRCLSGAHNTRRRRQGGCFGGSARAAGDAGSCLDIALYCHSSASCTISFQAPAMVGHDGNTEDLAAVRMMLEVEKAKCSRTWDKLADFQTPAALNW